MRSNGPGAAAAQTAAGRTAAQANGNGAQRADLVGNIAEFGEDLLSLAELQSRLAAIELKQNIEAVKYGGAVIALCAALGLAAIPIALAGIAELLVSMAGMDRGLALIAVAVATLAIAGLGVAIAAGRLRASNMGFPLSREEFARNLNWIRTVIVHSGRSARRWR